MGLGRSIRVIFGIAVTSSVAVILSGNALAAESSSGMTSQRAIVTEDHQSEVSQTSDSGLTSPIVTVAQEASASEVPASQNSDTNAVSNSGDVNKDVDQKPVSEAILSTGIEVSGTEGALEDMKEVASRETMGASTNLTADMPEADGEGNALVRRERIVFNSQILTVQPTITNRSTPVARDLAASLPTAPDKAPHPAHPSGLLGELSAELAATVVPQLFALVGASMGFVPQALTLAMLLILVVNVFTFTYGLWLRRSGFSTAARSNAPNGALVFAPSLQLDYVSSLRHQHSPIFVMANNKTSFPMGPNALRKEEIYR